MALKAYSLAQSREIQSTLDSAFGTPEASTFVLGAIDVFVNTAIFDKSLKFSSNDGGDVAQVMLNEMNLEMVRFGLKGWRNFKGVDGNDTPFQVSNRTVLGKTYQVVSDDCLQMLGIELIRELAGEIRKFNSLSKEEAKKSDGA